MLLTCWRFLFFLHLPWMELEMIHYLTCIIHSQDSCTATSLVWKRRNFGFQFMNDALRWKRNNKTDNTNLTIHMAHKWKKRLTVIFKEMDTKPWLKFLIFLSYHKCIRSVYQNPELQTFYIFYKWNQTTCSSPNES